MIFINNSVWNDWWSDGTNDIVGQKLQPRQGRNVKDHGNPIKIAEMFALKGAAYLEN